MKSLIVKLGVSLLCLGVMTDTALGQIVYTVAFTRDLKKAGLEYAEPTEQWLHVTIPPRHEFMDYDLVLQNDRNDFEVRYSIHQDRHADMPIPASVTVSRLIASIASNDEIHEIHVKIPPDEFLKEAFNADRGVIAYFTPKDGFSEKDFGALLSLYAEDRPAVDIILLYMDPAFDPLSMYRSMRYADLRNE
ncbi:MAG TPA: hypothetical protein VI603_18610 [Saprospiraceae bacterium]|nr:hypothetical protein [Saprospiraceae bacterium]